MTVRFSNSLRRFTLRCLVAIATAVTPTFALAIDDLAQSPSEAVRVDMHRLIGWTSAQPDLLTHGYGCEFSGCGFSAIGTHDSAPPQLNQLPPPPTVVETIDTEIDSEAAPQIAVLDEQQSDQIATPSDNAITAIAAAACAATGVSVEQIVEPFAMVGPYMDDSAELVQSFNQWWGSALERAKAIQAAEESDPIENDPIVIAEYDEDMKAITALEPIDVEPSTAVDEPASYAALGASVLSEPIPATKPAEKAVALAGIEVSPRDLLVGGSAMIVTLKEEPVGYDWTAHNLKLWNHFPNSSQPFCVLDRALEFDHDPMWQEFDDAMKPAAIEEIADAQETQESIDRLVTRIATIASRLSHRDLDAQEETSEGIESLGQRVAALAFHSEQLANRTARLISAAWPQAAPDPEPSVSGEALLARAGALDTEAPVEVAEAPVQVAETPASSSTY